MLNNLLVSMSNIRITFRVWITLKDIVYCYMNKVVKNYFLR
jgi:hypothetical protein